MKKMLVLLFLILLLGPVVFSSKTIGQTIGDYTCYPIFVTQSVRPNVMILMSNDHTNFYAGYNNMTNYDDSVDYYGYFDHNKSYKYDGPNYFTPNRDNTSGANHYVPAGCTNCWSGNFLNWLTMCHGDFVRKALTGGRRSLDSATKTVLIRGDIPDTGHAWTKQYTGSNLGNLVPAAYNNISYSFYNFGTELKVKSGGGSTLATFSVEVKVGVNDPANNITPEAYCTEYPQVSIFKPEGLLQRYMDKIHFGLITYSHGKPENGGIVRKRIGDISTELNSVNGVYNQGVNDTMMRYINNFSQKGWDPTGEMFYEAVKYLMALTPTPEFNPGGQLDDSFPFYSNQNSNKSWIDPFDNWCEKSSIIILNDEYPSKDHDHLPGSVWPATLSGAISGLNVKTVTDAVGQMEGINGTSRLVGRVKNINENGICGSKNVDTLGNVNGICPTEGGAQGSYYIAGLAWYAFTNDLRSDYQGTQNIRTYSIAFRASPGGYQPPPWPMNQLMLAAKYGNFDDKDGDGTPNLPEEWDADGDGYPDAFHYAESGSDVEVALGKAFVDILERAASGTAVSVLATSGEGEGSLVQAFFRPQITSGLTEIKWLGYLQSVWVDSRGNLREDTNANRALDIAADKVISHFVDTSSGDTRIKRFAVSSSDPYPDVDSDPYETVELDEITAVWQAGKRLAERSAADRKIFTYIDLDDDDVVDESIDDPFDDSGEVVRFHTGSATAITPYLGVYDDSTWSYLRGSSTTTNNIANRVTNLIQYIRGNDISELRPRTFDYDNDGTDETWKLGDIIHSTPVTISKPPDNFHIIYGDESYQDFYNAFKSRETVVFVGANDGMLHAFTSWKYDSTNLQYTDPYPSDSPGDSTYIANEVIGDELWAFIPQSLLPHLKWLPSPDYSHVYYVDMKPKVFDAQILPLGTYYSDTTGATKNWGTFLLVGFNLGGGFIQAKEDFDYDGSNTDTGSLRDFYPSYVLLDVTEPRNPRVMWERSYDDLQASASTPTVVKVKDKWFAIFGSGPSGCSGESAQTGKVYVVDLDTGAPYQSTVGVDWLFETAETKAFMNSPVSLDKGLNFNVDGIYFGETYLSGASNWKGKVYKITIPWADTGSNYDGTDLTKYSDDPAAAFNPWQFSELFDADRPINATLALSIDSYENAWIYGGTGRYLNDADKTNTDTQYFFGIKDPFFNSNYEATSPAYYHSYSSTKTLAHSDLLDVDDIVVTTTSLVFENGSPYDGVGTWNELLNDARAVDGWIQSMTGGERILTKPTLLGGIVFVPSFVPSSDVCGFGGDSYLYGVYFETGTAYYKTIFSNPSTTTYTDAGGDTHAQVVDKISLGAGKASSLGVHVGAEAGAKGFIQQSTGSIVAESLTPALTIKSGLKSWREK